MIRGDSATASFSFFFFFNDTATTEIYTLSLHDALPISGCRRWRATSTPATPCTCTSAAWTPPRCRRSEEHTSELQSEGHISYAVFCLKKKIGTVCKRAVRAANPASRLARDPAATDHTRH